MKMPSRPSPIPLPLPLRDPCSTPGSKYTIKTLLESMQLHFEGCLSVFKSPKNNQLRVWVREAISFRHKKLLIQDICNLDLIGGLKPFLVL